MKKYVLKSPQRILVCDIPFPRDAISTAALQRTLDDFLSPGRIRLIPAVAAYLVREPAAAESLAKCLRKIISGYTMHDTTGRFGTLDEPACVVRLIVFSPDDDKELAPQIRELAREVVLHLVCKRLAEELATQQEVWALEYRECFLHRWVAEKDDATNATASLDATGSSVTKQTRLVGSMVMCADQITGHEFCE